MGAQQEKRDVSHGHRKLDSRDPLLPGEHKSSLNFEFLLSFYDTVSHSHHCSKDDRKFTSRSQRRRETASAGDSLRTCSIWSSLLGVGLCKSTLTSRKVMLKPRQKSTPCGCTAGTAALIHHTNSRRPN